jgi:hypothetical protein
MHLSGLRWHLSCEPVIAFRLWTTIPYAVEITGGQNFGEGQAGEIIVRPLLCSPEVCSRRDNQPWFLCGSEMFSYIAECLNPKTQRDSCSVRYDINLWGSSLAPLVRYFKKLQPGDHGGIVDLYEFLSEQAQTDACKKTN